ncbi:hypothetical protein NGM33_24315 [Nocardiopsis dassonvillei]|uniref:hypothetical protein n=1 Tax=Nocardiopsis dassonvillei TaxID=2014 RepID=UPI00102BC8F2|nr:hypothetical protein [Nocardiopsis dassonvillei]MCP3016459.1 hypothetical protein [Nocardiopsis dassonvillei]
MDDRTGPEYDVEISASVSADELTFDEVPEVRARTRGEPDHEGISGSERSGLPHGVRSGAVYTDIRVDYRLASRIRLTEEAPPDPDAERE